MDSNLINISSVSCGLFGLQEDHLEEYQSLDDKFIKNKAATFFFRASGLSMRPLIFPGDILIIDRSIENIQNKVAVVNLDGQFLCKRVIKSENKILLRSENCSEQDIVLIGDRDFSVWGVVISLVRELVM